MKKFRRIFVSFLLILCIISSSASATVVSLQIGNPAMTVNGVSAEIDPGQGTAPVIISGRTLVPVRAIIESLGGSVGWEQSSQTVTLNMNGDTIKLNINSYIAYLNNRAETLDVCPIIINDRTMLPIRFIAESFKLGVGWDDNTKTVTVTKADGFSLSGVPPYSGVAYVEVNGNKPMFSENEITASSFESYSDLDYLGRCGVCTASVGRDIMPTEERESISSVKPTGWQSITYDVVDGGYLYNRCHLIGYQLTSENANDENLITGTRYMNVDGMLPFENEVADYVEQTGNHVMYRATPVFEGENLVASGVLLEALSVEDGGAGVSFCVYCYNVQPGVIINYADGSSSAGGAELSDYNSGAVYVLNTSTKKFHYPSCASAKSIKPENRGEWSSGRAELIIIGFVPCGRCKP